MAPASASPQPRSRGPGETGQGGQETQATRGGELDREGYAQARDEAYGPLSVERQIKQDGRALILYARLERPDR